MPDSYTLLPVDPDRLQLADGTPCKLDALVVRGLTADSYSEAIEAARAHARKIGQTVRLYLSGDHRFFTEVPPHEIQ